MSQTTVDVYLRYVRSMMDRYQGNGNIQNKTTRQDKYNPSQNQRRPHSNLEEGLTINCPYCQFKVITQILKIISLVIFQIIFASECHEAFNRYIESQIGDSRELI